jgi:small subunit ribosomal protein S10
MKVKISITLKSFEAKQMSVLNSLNQLLHYSYYYKKVQKQKSNVVSVALPITHLNYTVLRSPHIDKKSREQFDLKIHKQLITINTEIKYIREKLYNLKFHDIPGIQMKVVFHTKTRCYGIK